MKKGGHLVKDMYAKVLKKTSNLSTESKLTIGKNIEAYVNKNLPSIEKRRAILLTLHHIIFGLLAYSANLNYHQQFLHL